MDDKEALDALVRDMHALKASLRKNQPLLRNLMLGRGWGILSFEMGIGTAGFAVICHFLVSAYGSFGAIPTALKLCLIAFIVAVNAVGIVYKLFLVARRSRELEQGMSLGPLISLYFTGPMLHASLASVVLMLAGSLIAGFSGMPWLAVPIVCSLIVVPVNAIADMTGFKEYYLTGYACLAGGIAAYFLIASAPFLALALAAASAYFSFGIATTFAYKRRGRP